MLTQLFQNLSERSTGVANYPHWGGALRSLRLPLLPNVNAGEKSCDSFLSGSENGSRPFKQEV